MARLRKIARRTFLIGAAAIAGGFAVGYYKYRQPYPNPLADELGEGESAFNSYVKIDGSGKITVIAPRAEMGQGVSTTLAALVAEELYVPLEMIAVEHGPASHAYFNGAVLKEGAPYPQFDNGFAAEGFRDVMQVAGKFIGMQVTGGSSSIVDAFEKMRRAGAAAREMLISAAAAKLNANADNLTAQNGEVTDPASGKSLTYGELAADAAKLPPPEHPELKPPEKWTLLGKPQKRVDMLAKVTGAPIFGIDVVLPEMVFATVRMNPRLGGPMKSFRPDAALKVKGVSDVIEVKTSFGHGIAVIAANTWSAFKGAEAVEVEWGEAPYPATTEAIAAALREAHDKGGGTVMRAIGDVDGVFASDSKGARVEATYTAPFLAHAAMEPMNATARFKDGVLDVWAPNQVPTLVRSICAGLAGIDTEKCHVHTTHLGGGFGRRGEVDFAAYATVVALRSKGRPVKVTWTREEDMTHDMYRPMAMASFRGQIAEDGKALAFAGRITAPSIVRSILKRTFPSLSPMGPDKAITDGGFNQPYAFRHLKVEGIEAAVAVPVGFWRSVGNSQNGFFHESFIDEMAVAAKVDPMEFRLALTEPYAPAHNAIRTVAEMSDWKAPARPGRAKGIAFTLSFGSWVAQVIEISQSERGITLENLWCAADVGRALDPEILTAQITSGAIFGLSSAMGQEITFANGEVQQRNFFDFDAMRIWQAPKFDVRILETAPEMGGAGEIGTPPAIPALANAIFALTGKRIRSLPLSREVTFA